MKKIAVAVVLALFVAGAWGSKARAGFWEGPGQVTKVHKHGALGSHFRPMGWTWDRVKSL